METDEEERIKRRGTTGRRGEEKEEDKNKEVETETENG